MVRVKGIDHISITVGDFAKSKAFYAKLLDFLGFELKYEFTDSAGWSDGKTLYWINQADREGKKHPYRKGNIGLHHYAFELSKRGDVDALDAFLRKHKMTIVDPAGEYYSGGYYAVYFLDPDGIKLEGMYYPPTPRTKTAKRRPA
jgi:catechol 2,3-dioxygenase-like lactoylglutathione lyase family enzyme